MSTEWQTPDGDGPGDSKKLRTYATAGALVVVLGLGAYAIMGLGGGDEPSGDVVLGAGLSQPSADGGTPAASEAPAATEGAAGDVVEGGGAGDSGAEQSLDVRIDDEALVFDSSFVTGIAAAVSQEVFPDGNAENVILASDQPTGDALAAGALVGLFDTTLLLTDTDEISPSTAQEIDRLGNPRVHILGGPDVVSTGVEQQLADAGHDVHRHAGPRQAHTAVDIAGAHFPDARSAVLVRTPDRTLGPVGAITTALSGTSLAAAQNLPVLMTEGDDLTDVTAQYLQGSLVNQVIVVGNEEDIDSAVTSRLRELGIDWLRWGGADRFETAVQVAVQRGFQSLDDADVVVLVEGGHDSVWPAGFLGAIQAAHENGPVLLTDKEDLPQATVDFLGTAGEGGVDVVCTPGVTRQACAQAVDMVGGAASP